MLIINITAVLGAIALFTLLGFVNNHQQNTPCRKLEILITGNEGQSFVDEKQITDVVMAIEPELFSKHTSEVNTDAIHEALLKLGQVKDAHVYMNADSRCSIKVKQRTPIARILINGSSGYYIDNEGFSVPLSSLFTARVPVFVGAISEDLKESSINELRMDETWSKNSLLDDIYDFTLFIQQNPFLKAQVEHVRITSDNKMEIIPRVGNHRIILGDASQLEIKFRKLMAFYAETVHKADLNDYTTINLEYAGQVVCEKR